MQAELTTMSVAEAAESRRSIRKYTDEPIPTADLTELLRLVGRAPSAWNIQPWRFAVVLDAATKERLRAAAYGQAQVTSAPAVIVIYSDMRDALGTIDEAIHPDVQGAQRDAQKQGIARAFSTKTEAEREAWGVQQSNIALGYLMLLARNFGLDTSPMLGFDAEKVKEILEIPSTTGIVAMVPIGYAAEEGFRSHRHSVERTTKFI
ncbi:MAG TPA: nitroreductase family protein [Gemmatimonadaceae bacterium]|nr:nitroreductase family protein [Gemmatimonadaceae bacterium]